MGCRLIRKAATEHYAAVVRDRDWVFREIHLRLAGARQRAVRYCEMVGRRLGLVFEVGEGLFGLEGCVTVDMIVVCDFED